MFKKIWNWIKKNLGIVFAFIGGIITFSIFRGHSDKRARESTESALRRAGEGTEQCKAEVERAEDRIESSKERVERSEERIDRSSELSDEIEGNIRRAEGHSKAIREILEAGKKRAEESKN